MSAYGSETCPTPEGSTAAASFLETYGTETTDWASDLLSATQPVARLTEVDYNTTLNNDLNTPTIEKPQFSFGSRSMAAINSLPVEPTPGFSLGETVLAEYTVGAVPSGNLDEIPDDLFEDAWGNLGSPGEDLLLGVSPMEVEGKVDHFYASTSDSGGFVREIPFQTEPAHDQVVHTPIDTATNVQTDLSAPGVQTEILARVAKPSNDIENAFYVLESAPDRVAAKEEVDNGGQGEDLLKWLITDTIDENSAIPGEVKQEEFIPTTVNQVELNTLFSSYPSEESRTTYLAEPSTAGPIRFNTDARRRSRNLSVASTSSSVDAPRRGRGRPPRPPGRTITPAVVRGRIVSGGEESDHFSTDGNLTDAEISDLRYRRMRDLNNEASKRCRENRKKKYEALEAEADELKAKNLQLKAKLQRIESAVMKAKNYYITHIVPGAGHSMPDISQLWATAV